MSLLFWQQLLNEDAPAKSGGAAFFDSDFVSRAADPFGEAASARLFIRLNNGTGGAPDTLLELHKGGYDVLRLSRIKRSRELEFGVMQGQAWLVVVKNTDLGLLDYDMGGCWCCVQAGFEDDDVWQTFAQGKISKVTANADRTLTIEVHDAVIDLLNTTLDRPYLFHFYGDPGEIVPVYVDGSSNSYSNEDGGVSFYGTFGWQYAVNERFEIEFTSNYQFKILLEDGDDSQTGDIFNDLVVQNVSGFNVVSISSAGWNTGGNLYSVGDKFEFFTTRPYQGAETTPLGMIRKVITDICGISVYDVMNGAYYSTPFFDEANWSAAIAASSEPINSIEYTYSIKGRWEKGAAIKSMIQDALKLVNASIFPSYSGQIGVWLLQPSASATVELNGNTGRGVINILDGVTKSTKMDDYCDSINVEYLTYEGDEAIFSASTDGIYPGQTFVKTISIGWRCRGEVAQSCGNIFLNRFSKPRKEYFVPTTLSGILCDVGSGVSITEEELGISGEMSDAVEVQFDILGQMASIRCTIDPVALENYAIVGDATTDPVGSVVDGTDRVW